MAEAIDWNTMPIFGIRADGDPEVAHTFAGGFSGFPSDMRSLCGVELRLMRSRSESLLPNCGACEEAARAIDKRVLLHG